MNKEITIEADKFDVKINKILQELRLLNKDIEIITIPTDLNYMHESARKVVVFYKKL